MSNRINKKLILLLLLIPLIYIWGNNLGWFSSYQPSSTQTNSSEVEIKSTPVSNEIIYSSPKINPFARHIKSEAPQNANKRERSRKPQPPQMSNRPSSTYLYIGFIEKPPHSQAVVSKTDGSTMILESGDSLNSWRLKEITPECAVFMFEKNHDTLSLTK